MKSIICEMFGIDFPLLAFSHCRDVVTEVSKAGGMGVLGAADVRSPEHLETELKWIDAHVGGRPYGVDFIVPMNYEGKGKTVSDSSAASSIPQHYKDFARDILRAHDIDVSDLTDERFERGSKISRNIRNDGTQDLLGVAFSHPIRLIANALGHTAGLYAGTRAPGWRAGGSPGRHAGARRAPGPGGG